MLNEIEIIQNYIELEKIRYTERVLIDFNIVVVNKHIQIPPMLIIPFVENAFKHGVAKSLEKSWIKIQIKETKGSLNISVVNSKKEMITKDILIKHEKVHVPRRWWVMKWETMWHTDQEAPMH